MSIEIIPLGAGKEVGRSCVLVKMAGKTIMFDCGVHMGYDDERRYPYFGYLGDLKDYTEAIDVVLVTHFHLDHCGALPYFTEIKGYSGPVLMSAPARAIIPLMLEDFRKVCVEHKGETNFYTQAMIKECCNKVRTIELHQTLTIGDINIRAYYAGHVLGAVMFYVECRGHSVVYTGDYNVVGDRHLRSAWIERLDPHVIISESTYATKFRELKMRREKVFLKKVIQTIDRGGKVLIPVFALGRAQELCILLDTYWQRAQLDCALHFAGTLTEKANQLYKTFINWCNENVQRVFLSRNMFDFQHITQFDRGTIKSKDPMVLIATPGMLHGGLSLAVFKEWCDDSKNTIIIPGYCVPGTVGHTLLKGADVVNIDGKSYDVRCEIQTISFSAHSDHRGILQVLRWVHPDNVVLVHGEEERMRGLMQEVQNSLGVPCYYPGNLEKLVIKCEVMTQLNMDYKLLGSFKEDFHRNEVESLLGNQIISEVQGNVYQDWIEKSVFLFSYSFNGSLDELKEKVPGHVVELVKIQDDSRGTLTISWDEEHDEAVGGFFDQSLQN
jgi:integrator complex subunit 11